MSASPAEIPSADGATSPSQLFVINLCASTSPCAGATQSACTQALYILVSRQRDDAAIAFASTWATSHRSKKPSSCWKWCAMSTPPHGQGPRPPRRAPQSRRSHSVADPAAVATTPAVATSVRPVAVEVEPLAFDLPHLR